ncbi:Uncharacterised protein [Vibrio cholerae]|nr:Uncharacterised protein [Vibrio cholerae]CSI10340.1 Uncharacterised protein [Vibrio cholerae]CSI43617.1 Uncharacterised protein [Vibrio cholerae]
MLLLFGGEKCVIAITPVKRCGYGRTFVRWSKRARC